VCVLIASAHCNNKVAFYLRSNGVDHISEEVLTVLMDRLRLP